MVATNTPNNDALASPLYNPSIDQSTLQIFNIMGSNAYPADLVAQYRDIITGMPTTNPFAGVINNPRSCDVSQAQTGLATSLTDFMQRHDAIVLAGTPVPALTQDGTGASSGTPGQPGYQPSADQIAEAAAWQDAMPSTVSGLNQATSAMSDFQSHTDRLISNFPAILGMIQGALGMATALSNLKDPCLGLNNFLGSLTGSGSSIMNKINAAIKNVMSAINGVLSEIKAAIAYVNKLIHSLIALVEAEITALIKSLIDSARLSLAHLLGSLPKDPCFKSILKTIGTGAALGVLAKV